MSGKRDKRQRSVKRRVFKDDSEDFDESKQSSEDEYPEPGQDPLSKPEYQKFNFQVDTFPEIFPLGFFQQGKQPVQASKQQSVEALKKQITIMSEELQREFDNNKVVQRY